jgi:hypothetical protein
MTYVDPIIIHRGRTEKVTIHLAYSVAGDQIYSQIRKGVSPTAPLIATFTEIDISEDGRVITLTLDDSITGNIHTTGGFMDLKRVTGGEPVTVLDEPLAVIFKNVVTA